MKIIFALLTFISMPLFVIGQDILEVENNSDGIVFPRMSTQPQSPVQGQCFFNTTLKKLECFDGVNWVSTGPGVTGATGTPGSQGPKGDTGATGATGSQGPKGDKGDTGAPGIVTGGGGLACWDLNGNGTAEVATEDTNGDNVVDIFDCRGADGVAGATGATGAPGTQGPKGDSGATGATGATGPKGDTGPMGAPGIVTGGGLACWDLNGNGTAEVATEDTNGDNVVNIFDCRGANGATGATGATGANGATGATGPAGTANLPLLTAFPSNPDANRIYVIDASQNGPGLWWYSSGTGWVQL